MTSIDGSYFKKDRHCDRLQDAFATFLPKQFRCRIRYTHTPPRPCEPLFSPCLGAQPEKTKLASHFLTISLPARDVALNADEENALPDEHIFVFAMEVLIYSTKGLVTMFVSKADSTGYLPHQRPSPIKTIATTFLWWLGTQQQRKQPQDQITTQLSNKKVVISLFARSQSQYLFPGSADNGKKHILDDRQLIKWWARVLDPLFPKRDDHKPSLRARNLEYQGYMTVPGYHGMEIKPFFPSYNLTSGVGTHWEPGNPLRELAQARGLPEFAPTRCLLPRFPDDPKARFMADLDDEVGLAEDAGALAATSITSPSKRKSGAWKNITDLDRFWEAMEFRQECSSGRVVGFLWLVIRPSPESFQEQNAVQNTHSLGGGNPPEITPSQDFQRSRSSRRSSSRSSSKRRKPLTGPIKPRQPRLKGGSSNLSATSNHPDSHNAFTRDGPFLTKEGYDSAMRSLLNLEFSTPEAAGHSTSKWVAEVSAMSGVPDQNWARDVEGTAELEELPRNASSSAALPTNDLGSLVRKKKRKAEE